MEGWSPVFTPFWLFRPRLMGLSHCHTVLHFPVYFDITGTYQIELLEQPRVRLNLLLMQKAQFVDDIAVLLHVVYFVLDEQIYLVVQGFFVVWQDPVAVHGMPVVFRIQNILKKLVMHLLNFRWAVILVFMDF